MADYEIALLVSSQLQEPEVDATVKRCEDLLASNGATVLHTDRWGVRKLAYEVAKQPQANFTFIEFETDGSSLPEIDRLCKLDDSLLRHMIVVLDERTPPPEPEVTVPEEEEEETPPESEEEKDEEGEE